MSKSTFLLAAFAILSLLYVSDANSQIVFDNGVGGAAGNQEHFASDPTFPLGALGAQHADDVQFNTQHTITGVQWTGVDFNQLNMTGAPPAIDDFNIMIFLDNSGVPASSPIANFNVGNAVNRTDSGFDSTSVVGEDVFEFSAAINFTMNAGTTYWISIVNNTVGDSNDFFWGGVLGGNAQVSVDRGANWDATFGGGTLDFRLEGFEVPEPSSALIIAIASSAFFVRRRNA